MGYYMLYLTGGLGDATEAGLVLHVVGVSSLFCFCSPAKPQYRTMTRNHVGSRVKQKSLQAIT